MSIRICLIQLFFVLGIVQGGAQTPGRTADFLARPTGGGVQFQPVLPPLQQIAGAPPAFWDHYWEFGDGGFSFEAEPFHAYPAEGEYEVLYLATGKYDNGKAPRSRKKKTQAPPAKEAVAFHRPHVLPDATAALGMKAVRDPRAEEEFVCILSYANRSPVVQSGRLFLFFNQKAYPRPHFDFLEARTHWGEEPETEALTAVPTPPLEGWAGTVPPALHYALQLPPPDAAFALEDLRDEYRSERAWRFQGLQPDEVRNLFVSLQATPSMLRDTSALIHLSGLLLSEDGRIAERFDLELEIVASHDPNHIAVSRRRMGFRGVRRKDLTYKVRFQNTGEGPASRVEITCEVPRGLDPATLEILEHYPECPLCPETPTDASCLDTTLLEDRIVFTFRNIYLPGTRQPGLSERDSTKGFIRFRLQPARRIRKQDLAARASIVFDKNPPIRTNRARTDFKPGLSPALLLGRTLHPQDDAPDQTTLGLALAPFKPYRLFLQGEVWFEPPKSSTSTSEFTRDSSYFGLITFPGGTAREVLIDSLVFTEEVEIEKSSFLTLVPLQLRYNLSGWLSLGAGAQLALQFQKRTLETTTSGSKRVFDPASGAELTDFGEVFPATTTAESTSELLWRPALFADVHFGKVRLGPALGIRGVLPLHSGREPYLLAFVYWKI
ncbi:MAG: hypothetical protein D6765_14905 [Bacteroidetes bacterium]|nr:MAG: hypothetical protein D6765_14905 [Bacteroidota bacterium]